jgi:aspartate racemase
MQAKRQKLTHLLLTSSASRQQKLYHSYLDTHGVVYTEVAPGQQQLLDEAIGLVMAHHLERAGAILEQIVATAQANGFEGIIAGCTELPVALAHCKNVSGLQIIDSNDELAKALLKYYYAVLKKSALKKGGK